MSMTDHKRIEKALKAREKAYAPYSHFAVGAVLETAEGACFCGCNVENASYGLSMCAERTALFSAVAAGYQQFAHLTIVGGATDEDARIVPCAPCGACLQVLSEFCAPELRITLCDRTYTLSEFLPIRFAL